MKPYLILHMFLVIAVVCPIAGCKSLEEKKKRESFVEKWQQKAEESRMASAANEQGKQETEKTVAEPVPSPVKSKKVAVEVKAPKLPVVPVTVKFFQQDLSTVIRSLGKIAGVNVIVDDSLKETVTMELKEVPWNLVFANLLKAHSLDFEYDGILLKVHTPTSIRKQLELQKMREELNQAKLRVQKTEPLIIKTIKIDHLDVEKTAEMIKKMLTGGADDTGKGFRGSVEIDRETNTIIMNAVSSDIEKMSGLVQKLDKPATQILIEAQIVVTTKRAARQLGMQWGGLIKNNNTFLTSGANSDGILGGTLDEGINPTSGNASNFPGIVEVADGGDGSSTGAGGSLIDPESGLRLGLAYADSNMILSAQLSALEGDGEAHILSSPTITTLDNVRAFIESGSEIPYQSNSDNQGTTTEFKKAVLRLDVTPHVIDNELIKLDVEANNDEPDRTITNKDLEPAITTRKTKTTVLLKDGQTTVIAGLTKEYTNEADTGIPVLMHLPYVGKFFKSANNESEMSDLLIFITPHIVGTQAVGPKKETPVKDEKSVDDAENPEKEDADL